MLSHAVRLDIQSCETNGRYDNNGMLMIDGAAAGTPDRVNYLDKSGHARYDLAPWVLCGGDDEAYKTYNIGRPPNKGKGPNGEICGD